MFVSGSGFICHTCNRNLPRAASRCPWCKMPLTPSQSQYPSFVHGPHSLRFSRPLPHINYGGIG